MLQSPGTLNISVTDRAAEKVKVVMEKQGKKDAALRLYVSGGAAVGSNTAWQNEEDHVVETHGVKVLVDEESAPYLDGSEIDYVESVMGEGFQVNNPNATETCGCGHSFKPK